MSRKSFAVGAGLILLGLALLQSVGLAAPRIGTFAWNYKNRPVVAPYNGFEYVAVSPRALLQPAIVDSLRSFGATPIVWLQPTLAIAGGAPLVGPDYPWDTAVVELATRRNALLRSSSGAPVDLFPGPGYDAWILDYRDTAFVDEFAALIVNTFGGKAAGVFWDYGCGDVSWASLDVDPAVWPAWRSGFRRLVDRVRTPQLGLLGILQCDQWPADLVATSDGAFFEQCGMSLNPLPKVWTNANRYPGKWTFVRVEELVPQKRRAFAALAYLTDARFNLSDLRGDYGGGTKETVKDYEHFTLSIGASVGPPVEVAPRVWRRTFTRGLVILNLSASTYVYSASKNQSWKIAPNDGFVLQNRDELGRWITIKTNAGR